MLYMQSQASGTNIVGLGFKMLVLMLPLVYCEAAVLLDNENADLGTGMPTTLTHNEEAGVAQSAAVHTLSAASSKLPSEIVDAQHSKSATELNPKPAMSALTAYYSGVGNSPASADANLEIKEIGNVTAVNEQVNKTRPWWKIANLTMVIKISCNKGTAPQKERGFSEGDTPEFSMDGLTPDNCTTSVYTFCHQFFRLYHYRPSTNTCMSTQEDPAQMCNRSPDRFATMAECRRTCLHSRRRPEVCHSGPLFSECTWRDVKPKWSFFDGTRCKRWPFPEGLCPAPNNERVFTDHRKCDRRCKPPRNMSDGSPKPCSSGMGRAVTCTANVLRYPYFASYSSGKFGCFRASVQLLSTHHCLVSRALFANRADCRKTCVEVPVPKDICLRIS
ncbi:uncharacterized protein [Dermacentor albipictus]